MSQPSTPYWFLCLYLLTHTTNTTAVVLIQPISSYMTHPFLK